MKKEINLKFNSVERVYDFIHITTHSICLIDIKAGCCDLDGKSLVGLLSLDFSKPVLAVIYGENDEVDDLINQIRPLDIIV